MEPTDPAALLAEARAARERCAYVDAERLARAAAGVALRRGDVTAQAAALRIAGRALVDRGETTRAVRELRRALSLVPAGAEGALRAQVEHDLFCACGLSRGWRAAAVHYTAARRHYPDPHPRRRVLEEDRAALEVLAHDFGGALSRLNPLREHHAPSVYLLAHLAVAQAGVGHAGARATWLQLRGLIEDGAAGCSPWAGYACAWAAALLSRTRDAQHLASAARRVAVQTGDSFTSERAAELLRRVSGG